jgi:transcriptional regulator with XRE-family HTH domain
MAAPPTEDFPSGRTALPQILKAIRRRRGLRSSDVARDMHMPLRSYEHFESGRAKLNVAKIHEFAEVVDADPFAILTAMEIGSPAFALRCIDNKLMTILTMALQDFDATAGDDIARMDPMRLLTRFNQLFDELTSHARAADDYVARWKSGDDPPSEE